MCGWVPVFYGISLIFSWGSTCLAHIRFRKAWLLQGNTLAQLPYKSPFGIIGAIIGLILNILIIAAAFYSGAWPIGEGNMTSNDRANSFFESMISLIIVLAVFGAHKLYTRSRFVRMNEIDVQTGRRDPVSLEVLEQERAEERAKPFILKLKDFFF